MNFYSLFIEHLNHIAILTKAIRLLDTCHLQLHIHGDKKTDYFVYYEIPEDCPYDKFCAQIQDADIGTLPVRIADEIASLCLNPLTDKQYLKQIITNMLDLEYDTDFSYSNVWEFLHVQFPMNTIESIEAFVQQMPILRKRIELSFGVDIYAKKRDEDMSNNLVSEAYLRKVYDILNGDAFENISFNEFRCCVSERNFSKIYNSQNARCSKVKYTIYTISRIAGKEWYLDTAHSINTEPQKCSGATVPKLWRKKLNSIRT